MHLEALTSSTKKLWSELKNFPEFVLGGGTALALQIGHRIWGARITFLTYRFPAIADPVELQGIRLFSILDIAATKAYALGRRATLKDYVDLYFIVQEKHCSLKDIVGAANRRYGSFFDPRLFFEQLIYLKDVSEEKIRFLKQAVSKDEVEKFFEAEISKFSLEDG